MSGMAGGIFVTHNKVRPGMFANVKALSQGTGKGERGTVLFLGGSNLPWGKDGIIELAADTDFKKALGINVYGDLSDASTETKKIILGLREALKGAKKVLYYNVNKGVKAKLQDEALPWDFESTNGGTKGNEITISITPDVKQPGVFVVETIFEKQPVTRQVVRNASSLKSDDYVTVSVKTVAKEDDGATMLAGIKSAVAKPLAGGTDTSKSDVDLTELLNAVQVENFETVTAAGYDATSNIHKLIVEAVRELRTNQGKYCQGVVPDGSVSDLDYEGIICVGNGVVLSDGTELTASQACGWVAGAGASAGASDSLTYEVYPSAKDVAGRLSNEQVEQALLNGKLVFTQLKKGSVVIEQDINSLHTLQKDKNLDMRKNRIMRCIDTILNDTKENFGASFIGKVDNNEVGRGLFKGNRIEFLNKLAGEGAIQAINKDAVQVSPGEKLDQVVAEFAIQPVDAMEQLYLTVTL